MNPSVFFFFIHSVLATIVLGTLFIKRRNDGVFKNFGIALWLDAIAFAIWSIALINPASVVLSVTIGMLFFLASLVYFMNVFVHRVQEAGSRYFWLVVGILGAIGLFCIGRALAPGHLAYVSPEGLLFFNGAPLAQMVHILALMLAGLPAIDLLASKFKSYYSALVRYVFILEAFGGIILITSVDYLSLYITGWIMGLAYLLLWTTLLFNKKAWAGVS